MATALLAERLTSMTQDPTRERFDALNQRREELGVSVERLSRRADYKSTQTWRNLRNSGGLPLSTLARFEKALDWIEEHADEPEEAVPLVVESAPAQLIELEVTGDFGVRVVVRAPVANADELERFAAKIIRDIRAGQDPTGDPE